VDVEGFWRLIDSSEGDGLDGRYRSLVERLAEMPTDEIHEFNLRWHEAQRSAYSWDLWGAAYLINGGASDDGFEYFRDWLVLQGSAVFQRAIADPDTLAEVIGDDKEYEFECYPAIDAWEKTTGRDVHAFYAAEAEARARLNLPEPPSSTGGDPAGQLWDFDDEREARRRLPRLAARAFAN
jgi:Protein of unknown function (DUF4240)